MANTYVKIATVNASGSSGSMVFSSIPSTYTDLCLKVSARGTSNYAGGGYYYYVYPNGATTNLSTKYLFGNGTSAQSGSSGAAFAYCPASDWTTSAFSDDEIYLPNYAGSTNKSYSIDSVSENNATLANSVMAAGLWSQTTAISSLTLTIGGGSFALYSTATLYGISKS